MDDVEKQVLSQLRSRLLEEVHITESFLRAFCDRHILDDTMMTILKCETNDQQRVGKLLDILPSRGSRAFSTLVEILETTNPWLTEKMKASLHEERNRDAKFNLHPSVAQSATIEGFGEGRMHIDGDIKDRSYKFVRTNLYHLTEVEQRGVEKWLADELQRERRRQQFRARHQHQRNPTEFQSSKETQTETSNMDLLELYEEMAIYLHGVDYLEHNVVFSFNDLQQQVKDLLSRTRKLDALFLNCVNKFEDNDKYVVSLPELIDRAIQNERKLEQEKISEQKLIEERDSAKRQVERLEKELERLLEKQTSNNQTEGQQRYRHGPRYTIQIPEQYKTQTEQNHHQQTELQQHSSPRQHIPNSSHIIHKQEKTCETVKHSKEKMNSEKAEKRKEVSGEAPKQTQPQQNHHQQYQPYHGKNNSGITAGMFAGKIRRHASEESLKIEMSTEEMEETRLSRLSIDSTGQPLLDETQAQSTQQTQRSNPPTQRHSRLDLQKKMQSMLHSSPSAKNKTRRSESEKATPTHIKNSQSRGPDVDMLKRHPGVQFSYDDSSGHIYKGNEVTYMSADGKNQGSRSHNNGAYPYSSHHHTNKQQRPFSPQRSYNNQYGNKTQSHNRSSQYGQHTHRQTHGSTGNRSHHQHRGEPIHGYPTSGYMQRYLGGSTSSSLYYNHDDIQSQLVPKQNNNVSSQSNHTVGSNENYVITNNQMNYQLTSPNASSSTPDYTSDSELVHAGAGQKSKGKVRFASPVFRTTNPNTRKGHGGRRIAHYQMDTTSSAERKVRR